MTHKLFPVLAAVFAAAGLFASLVTAQAPARENWDYRLLATNKTSTMQKEMNEAADAGFRFQGVMGGQTSFGGNEVVTIMAKPKDAPKARYKYLLLATNKTSTMQKEMQQSGDEGYDYKGQTYYFCAPGCKDRFVKSPEDFIRK